MRRATLLLFCFVCVALAGCGNKGPLVLPSHPAAASTSATPGTTVIPARARTTPDDPR